MVSPCMGLRQGRDADVLVIGDCPNEAADFQGTPFSKEVYQQFARAVPPRELQRISMQNIVRCRTADKDLNEAAYYCGNYLDQDIATTNPAGILGMGEQTYYRMVSDLPPGEATVYDTYGLWFPVKVGDTVRWFMPTFSHDMLLGKAGKAPDRGIESVPMWPVMRANIRKFFDEVDSLPAPRLYDLNPADVILVHKKTDAMDVLQRMNMTVLGCDLETGNDSGKAELRPYNKGSRILSGAISDGELTMAFAINHPEEQNEWALPFTVKALQQCDRWVAHNIGFELAWLIYFGGLEIDTSRFEDSMAIARLMYNRNTFTNLACMSRQSLGVNIKGLTDINAKLIMNYPLASILPYNGIDAQASALIYKKDKPAIKNPDNYSRIIEATVATTQMQLTGLPVHGETTARLKTKWQGKVNEALAKVPTLYEVRAWERDTQKEFSLSDEKAVGEALVKYGRVDLSAGKDRGYKMDEDSLLAAAPDNPLVQALLAVREGTKLISTYLDAYTEATQRTRDMLIHPCYSTMLTHTFRLSSEDPNIQNVPGRKNREIRGQIRAPVGHILVAFDYGQIQVRIVGIESEDRNLIDSILKKVDMHTDWRDRMLAVWPEYFDHVQARCGETADKAILKAARNEIKNDYVFASLFGSTADSCARRLRAPREILHSLQKEFWSIFPDVPRWHKRQRDFYRETGCSRIRTGHLRHGILGGNEPINCVDYETEALTQRGWLNGHDIEPGDVLLTLNPSTQMLEWQSATDVKKFPDYEGEVWRLEGKSFSAVTTPDHRWVTQEIGSHLIEHTTKTLPKWSSLPRCKPFNAPRVARYSDDFIRLVGWILTDGSYSVGEKYNIQNTDYRHAGQAGYSGSMVTLCQCKPLQIVEIDALLIRLELPARRKMQGIAVFWTFSGNAGQWFRGMFPTRQLSPEFLLQLTLPQLHILMNTMIAGDGSTESNGRQSFVAGPECKQQIDSFQMLSILCGRPTAVSYRAAYTAEKQWPSMGNIPVSKGCWQAGTHRRMNISLGWVERKHAVEKLGMWCPMVPNTFFMARRQGKIYITGNTPIQGLEAMVVADAMNECAALSRERHDPYLHPRFQVHDDLTFILPDDERLMPYIDTIKDILVRCRYPWQILPWTIEAKAGQSWDELTEFAVFTGDYQR